jgi:diaminopimelate epimerase
VSPQVADAPDPYLTQHERQHMINFTKMHGLGNDFVVIDAINQSISLTPEQIRLLSNRHFGIGFDQLLLVEKPVSDNADFKYRIFNADGSEVAQCGNGARCFARFVRDKKLSDKNEIRVDTNSGQLLLRFDECDLITVNMGIPKHNPVDIPLMAEQEALVYTLVVNAKETCFGVVSMGNPHAVIQVIDVKSALVADVGQILESHAIFPERANIGFMQVIDRQHIKLRVYERGAAETLACGSGACAAVVIGIEQNRLDHEVSVELPGGELTISWAGRGEPVFMTGPALSVFDGAITL